MIDRRSLFSGAWASARWPRPVFRARRWRRGAWPTAPPAPFSFERLKQRARDLGERALRARRRGPRPRCCRQIDYDAHGKIKFKTDLALWADGPSGFPGHLLPSRPLFPAARCACTSSRAAQAREILYDDALFRHAGGLAGPSAAGQLRLCRLPLPGGPRRRARLAQERLGRLPRRLLFPGHRRTLPIRPLGARASRSTPRSSDKPEEFPDFTHVYFETPAPDQPTP